MPKLLKEILFGGRGAATKFGDIGLLITRASLGLYMALAHGRGKLFHDGGFGPPPILIEGTAKMGFPLPTFFAWCAALAEFLCALLVAVGLFTRPAAAILVFNMGVAAFVAHGGDPWSSDTGGRSKEMAMLYLIPFLQFVFTGAGHFSADKMIRTLDRRPPSSATS